MHNLMVELSYPCISITSTENITNKPSNKYGVIVIFKYSASRIGAICFCTDGNVYSSSYNASSDVVTDWKSL